MALLTVELTEGLGNRLFRIAAAMGYAERWNMEFVFVAPLVRANPHSHTNPLDEICQLYPKVRVLTSFDSGTWALWADHPLNAFSYAPFSGKPTCNIILKGYFQTELYWPKTRKHVMPVLPHVSTSIDFSHTYFIHVRLGDYVGTPHELPLFDIYYPTAIKEIKKHDPEAEFLLISDNVEQAATLIKRVETDVIVPTAKLRDIEWLWIMSQCAGGICANSTFSWWGAAVGFHEGKKYIMPQEWIHPSMGVVRNLHPVWATVVPIGVGIS